MSDLTPVYDSRCKKYQTTRRRIFKDNDGKYKEKLEIINCEKRTLFGAPPFETDSHWKLEDLSEFDNSETSKSERKKTRKRPSSKSVEVKNSNRNFHVDSETFERHFKDALEQIISKLKCETINPNTFAAKEIEGVKKIFEKSRGNYTSSSTDVNSTK